MVRLHTPVGVDLLLLLVPDVVLHMLVGVAFHCPLRCCYKVVEVVLLMLMLVVAVPFVTRMKVGVVRGTLMA